MSTVLRTAEVFQALSSVCAEVDGVKVVIGVNLGDGDRPLVRPLSDDSPDGLTVYLVPGHWENIAGGAARVTYTGLGSIFLPRQQDSIGGDEVALMNAFDSLIDKFAAKGKAGVASTIPILQAVVITEGPGLSEAEWPVESGKWSLTWPFELEIRVNPNALQYQPQ